MPRNKFKDLEFAERDTEEYNKAVEELIEFVSSEPEEKKAALLEDDFSNFLYDHQIKSGTTAIPSFIFYYLFLEWCGIDKDTRGVEPPYTYEIFFAKASARFKKKRHARHRSYILNAEPFEKFRALTEQEIEEIKDFVYKYTSSRNTKHGFVKQPKTLNNTDVVFDGEEEVHEED